MSKPNFNYDEPSDTLYINFVPGEPATGIELNEHMLLRINQAERRVVGLTLLDYSILAQPTEVGLRSFPLTGLAELAPELRELVIALLLSPPIREILSLSAYTPTGAEVIPITSLRPATLLPVAA
jgi:uncharacterized protein YuzE